MSYTAEELAALSETEREALTAVDPDEDTTIDDDGLDDDGEDDGTDDDDQDDDGEGEEADKPAGESLPSDGVVSPAANENVASDDFDLDSIPPVLFVPKLTGEILPEYEDAIVALEAKLDEGEMSTADYRREVRKLEAASQNADISQQLWAAEQASFLKANPEYRQENADNFAKLNKEVIRVATDPATKHLTGIQVLYTAKNNLSEEVEIAEARAYIKAQKAAGKTPDPAKKTIPAKPAANRPNVQTLRDIPAADEAEVGQDKFSHLDKLSGVALERAVAKMSAAEYESYVQGA